MGKVVQTVATVVAGVALIATGAGAIFGAAAVTAALGVSAATLTAAAVGLSVGASLLNKPKQPKMSGANEDRLNASINVRAPRVIALGSTAMATDLRDQEFTGSDKEFLHRFFVVAAHRVHAIREIWFDDKLAWTLAGGVQGDFVGYLTVSPILEGGPGNAINISPRMGSARRFTGCAYVYLRFKLTGNSKKTESPFAQQVPTRMTIVGDGMPCYDPRQDSTQPGGSGAHRAADQTTWTWGEHARNPACQFGTWMLGWRIQNPATGAWKLSVGAGIPADRIDWQSIMGAANLCDEPIALSAGGTEPRYRGDGLFNENDAPTSMIVESFKACMNADLDDQDGLLRLTVFHNDLATPDADFDTSDVQDEYQWLQTPDLSDSFTVVRGSYIEPDPKSLYQPAPYTEASLSPRDGIERPHPADFSLVQSKSQAERLAKQRLQRQQYGGEFRGVFLASGWKVQKNSVVRFTFDPEGWTDKLFRVAEIEVRHDGLVPMVLREEHADIYAWDAEEGPAVQIAEPTNYAAGEAPIPQFLGTVEEGATVGATAAQIEAIAAAQATADAKGRMFWRDSFPSAAESQEGDTLYRIDQGNQKYRRLPGAGWVEIGGQPVEIGGERLSDYVWAPAENIAIANFNARNDRDGSAVPSPMVATDGTAVDHVLNTDGSADISFEWGWTGSEASIDGFVVLFRSSASSGAYTFGAAPGEELAISVPADRRAFFLHGVPADRYYSFAVYAYRNVDPDIASAGRVLSATVKATGVGENPYQPSTNVAFAGDLTGTVNGVTASSVAGATTNFNDRNDRNGAAIAAPVVATDGTAVDHAQNDDGSVDLSFEWSWGGSEADIDGWLFYLRSSSSAAAYTFGSAPEEETVLSVAPDKRAVLVYGVPANRYYTLGVRAFRVVDPDVAASGRILSALVKATASGENPYRPNAAVAFAGDITGTVAGQAATAVAGATVNFNARNDRNGAAIPAATFLTDGSAVDHVINPDGSADVSLEWQWPHAEADIDGFLVEHRSSTGAGGYSFGTAPAEESAHLVPASKRALILSGVAATRYHSFSVRPYRVVDPDVAASGRIVAAHASPTLSGETPYQPSANIAFAGDITGTVAGQAAATVAAGAAAANAGLNGDGTVKTGKVTAASMSGDVLTEIVSATASSVTATDAGTQLLLLPGVTVKPSQGGFVQLILTVDLLMTVSPSTTTSVLWAWLERAPAGSSSWTTIRKWRLGSRTNAAYSDGAPAESGPYRFLESSSLYVGTATQWADMPPADGDYDYRWLAAKSEAGTVTAPEVGAAVAANAGGLAISVKVAT